ncbi:hypothetical protein HDU97_004102 [Phlyctochytrium planicorne]|nr:hypothetical protein HDU97_004102 [Phlyctochytrium planicorne]
MSSLIISTSTSSISIPTATIEPITTFSPTPSPQPFPFSEFVTILNVQPRYVAQEPCSTSGPIECYVNDLTTALSLCYGSTYCSAVACGIEPSSPFRCTLYSGGITLYTYIDPIFNKTAYVEYGRGSILVNDVRIRPFTKSRDPTTLTTLPSVAVITNPPSSYSSGSSGPTIPPFTIFIGAIVLTIVIFAFVGMVSYRQRSLQGFQAKPTSYELTTFNNQGSSPPPSYTSSTTDASRIHHYTPTTSPSYPPSNTTTSSEHTTITVQEMPHLADLAAKKKQNKDPNLTNTH